MAERIDRHEDRPDRPGRPTTTPLRDGPPVIETSFALYASSTMGACTAHVVRPT
jgi:hypothetical protein